MLPTDIKEAIEAASPAKKAKVESLLSLLLPASGRTCPQCNRPSYLVDIDSHRRYCPRCVIDFIPVV